MPYVSPRRGSIVGGLVIARLIQSSAADDAAAFESDDRNTGWGSRRKSDGHVLSNGIVEDVPNGASKTQRRPLKNSP